MPPLSRGFRVSEPGCKIGPMIQHILTERIRDAIQRTFDDSFGEDVSEGEVIGKAAEEVLYELGLLRQEGVIR